MKKINFLLPFAGRKPVGGFKVVYEYANRLAADNYLVKIIYPSSLLFNEQSTTEKIRSIIKYFYYNIFGRYSCKLWFNLDNRVKEIPVWSLSEAFVPKADIMICTAVETAGYLAKYKNIADNHKFYLIQHFEAWYFSEQRVKETYHFPLRKIVIAEWLADIVHFEGEFCTLIHNGFDFDYFTLATPIESRDRYTFCMLYHVLEWKGVNDAIKALQIVKDKYPLLKVKMFGAFKRPKFLPDWYDFYTCPDKSTLNMLYNSSAIFLSASHGEGFCLTPPEAMMCGCALCLTNIGGFTVVAKDNENALLSPPHEPEMLAKNLIKLVEDDELRIRLAKEGNRTIKQFTWEKAYIKLRTLLEN
ncbi:MAG: glycosyltransferase family 4 protein [Bacteroidales bacterium]|jgi:glycosyltransferase involved in cell wall biosynthesis|nr:glycosyltransferase family 4 protein [Bacteroidales bacterium]